MNSALENGAKARRLQHARCSCARVAAPGTIFGSLKAVGSNNIIYEVEWALDPMAGPWTAGEPFTDTRRLILSGLPRGKDIFVRVRARNTNGPGPWSDVATIMVT
ncbi:MAG: fibronectin type III domain-containing protein [Verrucomicrobiota bacterium]|nr:fibronectin type III domain-containing protein [Verrucomicrobiota bacterium]